MLDNPASIQFVIEQKNFEGIVCNPNPSRDLSLQNYDIISII